LQSWAKHGWKGGIAQIYWFWRDRKGLVGNPLSLLGNLVCLYGLATLAYSRCSGKPWGLASFDPGPLESSALGCALLLQLHRIAVRTICAARIYGAAFAAATPLRAVWSNWLNGLATLKALYEYARARLRRAPLRWLKTEHIYPAAVSAMPPAAEPAYSFDPDSVRPEILRALPWRFVQRWGVVPVAVRNGSLVLAADQAPDAELLRELRRHTHLAVRVSVIDKEQHGKLMQRVSPQRGRDRIKSGSWH
jgi:hypothetical protein